MLGVFRIRFASEAKIAKPFVKAMEIFECDFPNLVVRDRLHLFIDHL